jgi:hypothetical protein
MVLIVDLLRMDQIHTVGVVKKVKVETVVQIRVVVVVGQDMHTMNMSIVPVTAVLVSLLLPF